jgi:hypothetical protein
MDHSRQHNIVNWKRVIPNRSSGSSLTRLSKGGVMSQSGQNSGFREGARKVSNGIRTVNLIFSLLMLIGMIVLVIWLKSQS